MIKSFTITKKIAKHGNSYNLIKKLKEILKV